MTANHCSTCGHVQQIVVWTRGKRGPQQAVRDQCIHPEGPHEMNEFCVWHTAKREGRTE